jgi:meso-butanediol dehydrogenase / (S,S)-butanediol dehydrogenase / diacetyl reductase
VNARKSALVTGASSGIGAEIARRLARDGFAVMAAGRDASRTNALAAEFGNICTWIGALATAADCTRLVGDCVKDLGGLDLLVNNAGIYEIADAEATSDDAWNRTLAINLSVPFFLARAALPALRKRRGAIVNIASDWGLKGGANAVAYCASKGGLVLMTRAMAIDHADEGIRINAVCPGDVETPMLYRSGASRGADAKTALREANADSRSGRVTTPEEVAALVAFLASDGAAQINGAAIPIDGGGLA